MTTSKLPDDLEIAPGYAVGCWKNLTLDPDDPESADWETALDIFDARIRCRFLNPADVLINHDANRSRKTFGFAILAIDCLVLETLQAFREGVINHDGQSTRLFTNFLKRWGAFNNCVPDANKHAERANLIYRGYRCALHHSASTNDAFRVRVSGPVFGFKSEHDVSINRTCLHEKLKGEFEAYLEDLRAPNNKDLRCNFLKKMNAICGLANP